MCEHTCKSEWNLLGELLSEHCNLETVTKVDVYNLASMSLEEDVGRVSIAKTQNVANHTVDSKGTGVSCATFEPVF